MIKNDRKLPSHFNYKSDNHLLSVNFSIDNIAKTLHNLDPNNTDGHDKISIHMLHLCCHSICKPLKLIFQQAMESGSFPSEWKKGSVVHKKRSQTMFKNLSPYMSAINLWQKL